MKSFKQSYQQDKCLKINELTKIMNNTVFWETGQIVTLTTSCGSYKELGKYLTEMGKKQWRMLKVTRKGN